jgi:hypothetical protein
VVDQLDGANLDDAMTAQRVKAGCLGVDDDFAHQVLGYEKISRHSHKSSKSLIRRQNSVRPHTRFGCADQRVLLKGGIGPVWRIDAGPNQAPPCTPAPTCALVAVPSEQFTTLAREGESMEGIVNEITTLIVAVTGLITAVGATIGVIGKIPGLIPPAQPSWS